MSDPNGKRKRVETVDLTAEDTDDTDDLDAPSKSTKRQNISTESKSQQSPDTNPVGSNNDAAASFRGSSYPFSGNSFTGSTTHTEAERRRWLEEDEDDINETISSTQLDAANGTDELHLYGNLDTEAAAKVSVFGALTLYLDFINMFQFLLALVGNRNE